MLCAAALAAVDTLTMLVLSSGCRYFTISEGVPNQLTELGMELLLQEDGLNASAIEAIKEVYRPEGGYPYPENLGNYSIW